MLPRLHYRYCSYAIEYACCLLYAARRRCLCYLRCLLFAHFSAISMKNMRSRTRRLLHRPFILPGAADAALFRVAGAMRERSSMTP